ncbi:primosomal protein [Isoptericola sediminis]|uniref:Primosomal protein n=1 Tax=Isoptericola sediminis TaxID=2733572 RepID=A0A849KBY9_9MICO|nr:primosomal protein [Isoptericola sediminis]NNU28767.1 primosomal protein [Isoptericola sediminis]
MTADPRAALDRFVAALEGHFHAVSSRRGDEDPAVDDAYEVLADAFEVYEDALAQAYSEVTPFYLDDDDDDDEDEDYDEDDDEASAR